MIFRVHGHSMEPILKNNQLILVVNHLFLGPLAEGGIVVFNWHGKKLVKRIAAVKVGGYLLTGDNTADSLEVGWVDQNNVWGKVVTFTNKLVEG